MLISIPISSRSVCPSHVEAAEEVLQKTLKLPCMQDRGPLGLVRIMHGMAALYNNCDGLILVQMAMNGVGKCSFDVSWNFRTQFNQHQFRILLYAVNCASNVY